MTGKGCKDRKKAKRQAQRAADGLHDLTEEEIEARRLAQKTDAETTEPASKRQKSDESTSTEVK